MEPKIDGYSDVVRIAAGGFGIVYRARQGRHGRVVALKVLDVTGLDHRAQRRFTSECLAMGALSWHPNVVALFDSGITSDGHPYLVMEFLEAGSLADRLARDGPLRWQDAVTAGVEVAGALGAAHAAGTLHRDLKPENLMIGPFGEAKLGDFGIAAVQGETRTTKGHGAFTVAHGAPEILGGHAPDERSDVYGLASTVHTLISGVTPLGIQPGMPLHDQLARVRGASPARLVGVPSELADCLLCALAKNPDDRPETATAFAKALQQIQVDNGEVRTQLRVAPIAIIPGHATDAPGTVDAGPRMLDSTVEPSTTAPAARPGSPTPCGDPSPASASGPVASALAPPPPPPPASSAGLAASAAPSRDPSSRRLGTAVAAVAISVLILMIGGSIAWLIRSRDESNTGAALAAANTSIPPRRTPTTATPTTTTIPGPVPVDLTVELTNVRNDLTDLPGQIDPCSEAAFVSIESAEGDVLVDETQFPHGQPIPGTGDLADCLYSLDLPAVELTDDIAVFISDDFGEFDPDEFSRAEIEAAGGLIQIELDGLGSL